MKVKAFFDEITNTLTYVVWDDVTKDCVVIDPVLGFNPTTGKVDTAHFQTVRGFIEQEGLRLHWLLETHAHADHISASQLYKEVYPNAKVGISRHITEVQKAFKGVFSFDATFDVTGKQFDHLIADGEMLVAGSMRFQALPTPGHTRACISYLIGDNVFTGDALFMPDYGTGRCDFPGGDARTLYHSISDVLYQLPDETKVWVGHDYQPNGRAMLCESTIGAQKADNIQLSAKTTVEDFVAFRETRDAGLATPRLLYASIQVNIDGGHLPTANSEGKRFLKMPLKTDAWKGEVNASD